MKKRSWLTHNITVFRAVIVAAFGIAIALSLLAKQDWHAGASADHSKPEVHASTTTICSLGVNLVANGNAETDTTAVGDGSADQDVSGWNNETGAFTVVRYDAPGGYPTSTGPGPSNRGTFFFAGGNSAASSASQIIDLSACSSQIDSGGQQFNLSGFLGGFGTQDDNVRAALTFRNAANNSIGTSSIGPVSAAERNNVTGLIPKTSTGAVPAGTRTVTIELQMTRVSGASNDAYADNLSFILSGVTNCSPLPSGALTWLKAEGNANDVLGVNNGTLQNGVSFSTGLVGQAFSFDGVDDDVSINRSIQDDFTIEFWLNTTQIVGADGGQWWSGRGLVDGEVISVTNDFGVTLQNGKVLFGIGNPDVTIRSGLVANGNWHHVAATRLRSTGEIKLYIDGLQTASAVAGTQSLTAPPRLTLGRLQVDSNPFQGKLDEVSIFGRVLSAAEIQTTFDAGSFGKCTSTPACTPPPANLVAWWRAEGNANDSIGSHNGTLQTVAFATGTVGQGFKLNPSDGTFDQVSFPHSADLAPANFTLETWVRFDSLDSPNASAPGLQYIMFKKNTRTNNFEGFDLHKIRVGGVDKLSSTISSASGTFGTVNSQTNVVVGQFYHVAVTYNFDGANGILKLYVNGGLEGSAATNFPPDYDTRPVFLGSSGETFFNGYLDGVIDEASIYNRALSAAEIQNIYGAGSFGKCDPALTCVTTPQNLISSWRAEGNANDSQGGNNGSLVNGATFATGKVGQTFSFDGVNDYVRIADSPTLRPTNVTLEAWINFSSSPTGTRMIFNKPLGNGILDSYQIFYEDGKLQGLISDVNSLGPRLQFALAPVFGTWYHVAYTFDDPSNVQVLYLNGVAVASGTVTKSIDYDTRPVLIGADTENGVEGSFPFPGLVDEASIYSRALSQSEIQALYDAGSAGKCRPGSIQSLELNPNPVDGGQPVTGTVTLTSAAPAGGAMVSLSSDNPSVATVPSPLTIAAGQTSGIFTIATSVPASDAFALITASYQSGAASASLTVLAPKPDLIISTGSVPANTQTDAAFNISWTDKNQGVAQANAPWTDRVLVSSDNQLGNDTLIAEFPFNSNLDPNQTVDRIQSLTIPRNAISQNGSYFLIIQTDGNNQVNEGGQEANNFISRPINITRPPKPDLVVDSIVAPNTAFFGQTIVVQWTVKNIGGGPTNAPSWQDWVYLSTDNVPEIEDPFKIPVTNINFLSAGETYTGTAEVKIPQGLVGQYKIIVWTDGDGTNHRTNSFPHQVIEDDDENNFGIARPIQINTPPLPDLQTTSVVAPEEVFAGAQMALGWRVENHGDGVTPPDQTNWLDKIYLSQDTTLDVNSDRLIGSRTRSGALIQNEGYTVSNFNIAIPSDIAGDWFVFVVADGENQVYEFNNENNNANYDRQQPGSPMHISATPPDLTIPNSLSAPATGFTGQALSIGWTVRNQGAFEAAPNWFDAVYLSADQTLNTDSDTLLSSVFRSSALGPGLTYSVTANVTVPNCISGSYYLFVVTDSRRQIFEFDPNLNAEANNTSQASPIQIMDATPDLRVTTVGHPATGNAGQQITVNWTVANQGNGATSATKWTDRVYLTPTQVFDAATALLIGSFDHTGSLTNGNNYARMESLTIPNAAQGSYFVNVLTDANNEVEECANNANNSGDGPQAIVISNSLPDLVVPAASSQSNPVGGQTVNVDWTVANQGTVAVNTPSWGDAVYFSSDAVLGNDDLRLATSPAAGPLAIGATYNRQVPVTLPVVAAGNYFLIVQADYLSNVFEGQHEDNNLRTVAVSIQVAPVDLTVTTVDAPATAFSGQDMTVNWTVRNNGANPTVGSHWIDEAVLSLDQIDDPSDRVVGSKQHDGALNSQSSYNDALSVFVPQGFTGQYYVFVRTDRRNEIAESNENNNSAADGTIFNLTPPADLVVSSIAPPSSASPGEPITVNWTIQNSGTNPATGLWNDAVYLSLDQTWDIGDILIGKQSHAGPIAASQSYSAQLTTTLPAISLGNYYVIVKTDAQNRVRETNDDNNNVSANTQTAIDVTALQIGVPRNTTLIAGQEKFYKTNAPANETLRFALEGQTGSANELFARFGLIATRTAFDFSFSRLNEANQELTVPNSQPGNYFTLARSEFSVPSPQAVTIKAEVIPFGITSVSSNRIGDNGQVTIILKGAKFADGATVKLVRGATVINSVKEIFIDATTFKARFMLTNAPHGAYDVVLTNPNNQSTVAIQAVTIETATEPTIEMDGSRDTAFPRLGRSTRWTGTLRNSGNVDIQYLKFGVNTESNLDVVMLQTQDSLPNQNYLPDGENRIRVSFFRDVAPNEERTVGYSIKGYDSEFEVSTGYSIQTKTEFLLQSQTESELLRLRMLNNPNLPPVLANSVNSPAAWWQTFKLFYTNLGLIDEDTQLNIDVVKKAKDVLLRKEKLDKISTVQNESCNGICDSVFENCYVEASDKYLDKLFEIARDFFIAIASCRVSIDAPLCLAKADRDVTIKLSLNLAVYAAGLTICGYDYQQCKCRCESEDNEELGCGFTRSACFPFVRFKYCPVFPMDPNDKIGPSGFGSQAFIGTQALMPYTINFENVSTATAYAQRVRITDQLDSNLDPRSVRLREIGFKQYRFQVPDNRAFFQQRVQLGPDLGNLLADISAGVDVSTGKVTWTMTAIDPTTGEQPNSATLGLLPPNNDSNDGQGFVTFTVKPKTTISTGAVIQNAATITFDTEAPINTNTVSNTIDAEAPGSAVDSLPATQPNPTFSISWSGTDAPGGSGLLNYDIYYSVNNGPYQPLLSGTTLTTAQFTGQLNTTYRFYSVARDNAGNLEAAPASPDAVTTVGACSFLLNPTSANFTAAGGNGSFTVTTGAGCNWTAVSDAAWLTTSSTGSGTGMTNFLVAANSGPARSATITVGGQIFNVTQNGNPLLSNLQFSATNYSADEGSGFATISVSRTGDLSSNVAVDFATADGTARQRSDYTLAGGTLTFASGDTSKTFRVLIVDDTYSEGSETLNLTLTNPVGGAMLGNISSAVLTIVDNDATPPTTNPSDQARFFVQQHYYDFLSRYPDSGGWDFWTDQITGNSNNTPPPCPPGDQVCVNERRINVSNAFYYELEFQQTGSYVYRLYRGAFGNNQPFPNPAPDPANPGEEKKVPLYLPFMKDRAAVRGGPQLAQFQLALANAFVQRPEFTNKYPISLSAPGFVDAVLLNINTDLGVDLTSQRQALIDLFNAGGRGAVMYRLADDNVQTNPINNRALIDAEYNRAFVFTQYSGYLRRNADMAGFLFWLGQVNGAPLRDVARQHSMVCSFITSAEYQLRFSSVVTHNNTECGQ